MKKLLAAFGTFAFLFAGSPAQAGIAVGNCVDPGEFCTLNDLNSDVTVDPDSSSGMTVWEVDDTDHLVSQWFWFRIGDTEEPVSDLELIFANTVNNNFDPDDELLTLIYVDDSTDFVSLEEPGDATFAIQIQFTLAGGSTDSGTADLAETITIFNFTDENLDVSFYEYVDFDLGGTPDNDTAELINPNLVQQTDGSSTTVNETSEVPTPDHHEIAFFSATLTKLNDGDADDLNDVSGPLTGNVTWAFQWDFTIGADGSQIISKNKNLATRVVAEPMTLGLFGTGLLCLGFTVFWNGGSSSEPPFSSA
jgi:hypothetical protein